MGALFGLISARALALNQISSRLWARFFGLISARAFALNQISSWLWARFFLLDLSKGAHSSLNIWNWNAYLVEPRGRLPRRDDFEGFWGHRVAWAQQIRFWPYFDPATRIKTQLFRHVILSKEFIFFCHNIWAGSQIMPWRQANKDLIGGLFCPIFCGTPP